MKTKKIDKINILIAIISLLIAVSLPFKIFLLALTILGPLHYLTEINWLSDKNYFIKPKKKWIIILVIFTVLASIRSVLKIFNLDFTIVNDFTIKYSSAILLTGFLFSIGLVFMKNIKLLLLILIIAIAISLISITYLSRTLLFIGVFLPTLIHVYLFTILFVFYGALKSKSKYGIYLGITLLIIPLIIYLMPINITDYKPSKNILNQFVSNKLVYLNIFIANIFGGTQNGKYVILSAFGIKLQIFIAFAYIYHYLNWFSKTSIIGWGKSITAKKSILILVIWFFMLGLYLYDFKTGFLAMFFLSFLHVILEFPLNIISIKEIFSFLKSKKISSNRW